MYASTLAPYSHICKMLVLKAPVSAWQKGRDVVIAGAVVALVSILGSACGAGINYIAGPFIQIVDPNNYFFVSSVTYASSLLITLVVMKGFSKKRFSYWGFTLSQASVSLKVFFWFCLIYTPLIYFFLVIDHAKTTVAAGATIDAVGIVGSLSNHLFISGISQEVLFRGFVMVFLSRSWCSVWRIGKIEIPYSGAWATLIFILAHVQPGQALLFYPWQVLLSLVLGLYYAIMFHKTKSLLNPVLSHSFTNTIYVLLLLWEASAF